MVNQPNMEVAEHDRQNGNAGCQTFIKITNCQFCESRIGKDVRNPRTSAISPKPAKVCQFSILLPLKNTQRIVHAQISKGHINTREMITSNTMGLHFLFLTAV